MSQFIYGCTTHSKGNHDRDRLPIRCRMLCRAILVNPASRLEEKSSFLDALRLRWKNTRLQLPDRHDQVTLSF